MLSTWLISFQCKLYATPIELHIKRSLSIRGFYLSSPFVFYSFLLANKPCFLYIHLSVLWFQCYCITLSRAFHPHTGIYMFVPSPSLLVILKTFSNCSFTYFDSIQAIMQIILYFHLIQKHLPLTLAQTWLSPIKRDFRLNQVSLVNYFIDHGSL